MQTVIMIDTIGASAHNIPDRTPRVAGYVTGVGDVPWSAAGWRRFPAANQVRIAQAPGTDPVDADVLDVETGAATPADARRWVNNRIGNGYTWSTIYGSASTLAAVRDALIAAGPPGWWYGHVYSWLAGWSLSEEQAVRVLGTEVAGMTCVAVQWASPASNPGTLVPGGNGATLAQANVDLSVCDASWRPALERPVPAPAPAIQAGYLVTGTPGHFAGRIVTSADGGRTWS